MYAPPIDYNSLPRSEVNYIGRHYDPDAGYEVPKQLLVSRSPMPRHSPYRTPQQQQPPPPSDLNPYRRPTDIYLNREKIYLSNSSPGSDFEHTGPEYGVIEYRVDDRVGDASKEPVYGYSGGNKHKLAATDNYISQRGRDMSRNHVPNNPQGTLSSGRY